MRPAIAFSPSRRVLGLLLAATSLACWLGCTGALTDAGAHFGPVLLLLGVLAVGLYPGEVAIARLQRHRPGRRAARPDLP